MTDVTIHFEDSEEIPVQIDITYNCEICEDTGKAEIMDEDGFPSGRYQKCVCKL